MTGSNSPVSWPIFDNASNNNRLTVTYALFTVLPVFAIIESQRSAFQASSIISVTGSGIWTAAKLISRLRIAVY
jgi:hypothetical protein